MKQTLKNIAKIGTLGLALLVAGCKKDRIDIRREYYMLGNSDGYTGMVVVDKERDYRNKTEREISRVYKEFDKIVSYDEAKRLEGLDRKVYFCDSHLPN